MASPPTPPTPTTACPRCGAPVYTAASLALLARQISNRADEGLRALDAMRLALPSAVGAALHEARLDGRILAQRLACHAGNCTASASNPAGSGPVPRPSTSKETP